MQSQGVKSQPGSAYPAPLYGIFFLSGVAGLGYEIVWTRMLGAGLGHEMPAMLAVVTAFFAGLAVGAFVLDGMISRSRRPGLWYVGLEITIAVWALVLATLIPWANRNVPILMGLHPSPARQWAVSFIGPLLLLLPATAAMGGTLPAMERLMGRLGETGRSVAGLYAVNTAGAVAGTLMATYVLIPSFGHFRTMLVLVLVNVLCAAGVLLTATKGEADRPEVESPATPRAPSSLRLMLTLALTGLLGVGYEVLVVRVLSQFLENTVYSFASVLSVYLLGTAVGAALYQRFGSRLPFTGALTVLLQALASACLLGVFLMWAGPWIYESVRGACGESVVGSILGEMAVAGAVLALPTMAMGATFSHLAQAARGQRGGIGRALGVNTLGASCASLLFGVLLLPMWGAKAALLVIGLGYLLLMPPVKPRWYIPSVIPTAAAAAILIAAAPLRFVTVPEGGGLAEYRTGVMASVAVLEDAQGHRHLSVNDFKMGGTASVFPDLRQGHIPLLLHPEPKRALFLGLGAGVTFSAAREYPDLEAECVELVPEIIDVLRLFADATGDLDEYKNLRIHVADARRYVLATPHEYDVIVADLFHPARDGAGALYTQEHFSAVKSRLAPGGVFCQWLPLYQMDLSVFRIVVRTFLSVFPDGSAWLCHSSTDSPIIGLIGGTPGSYPADWYRQRVSSAELHRALMQVNLGDNFTLFGNMLATADDLEVLAGDAPLNTDDRAVVIYEAPRFIYRQGEPASDRLLALLAACSPSAGEVITGDRSSARRLAEYWRARDTFLNAMAIYPGQGSGSQLLDSLRQSPDFADAYAFLLQRVIPREYERDPAAVVSLLRDMTAAHPQRPQARRVLEQLRSVRGGATSQGAPGQ